MQRDIGRYKVEVLGELPEDVVTNIQLYRQHMEEDDRDYALKDSIVEFVEMSFDELRRRSKSVCERVMASIHPLRQNCHAHSTPARTRRAPARRCGRGRERPGRPARLR